VVPPRHQATRTQPVPQFANRQRDPRGGDIQIRHGRGAAPVPVTNDRSRCGDPQREPVPAL